MLIFQQRFSFLLIISQKSIYLVVIFLINNFSVFLKVGETPLSIAVKKGYKEIVEILVEKGGANVDFKTTVFLFIEKMIFFSDFFKFFFQIFLNFFLKGWKNSSSNSNW